MVDTSVQVMLTRAKESSRSNWGNTKELLGAMPRIIESVTISKTHKVATYEGQDVPITEQQVDPVEQKITDFSPSENAWLNENRHIAAALGVKYGSGGVLTPEELDVVFSRWTYDDQDKVPGEVVASALGAAFGDYLVEQHEFRIIRLKRILFDG
jgi:hypothetical protein